MRARTSWRGGFALAALFGTVAACGGAPRDEASPPAADTTTSARSAALTSPPPTLTNEYLNVQNGPQGSVSLTAGTCNEYAGASLWSWNARGDATSVISGGPYAGSWEASGDVDQQPDLTSMFLSTYADGAPLLAGNPFWTTLNGYSLSFTIDSPTGIVRGTMKGPSTFSQADCWDDTFPYEFQVGYANGTYEATITTPDGSCYADHGTAAINVYVAAGAWIDPSFQRTPTLPSVALQFVSSDLSSPVADPTCGNLTPTLATVAPAAGSTAGGTVATITGTAFQPGASVTFGTKPATSVTVASPTSITATTPAAEAGVVDVTVTNPDGQSATAPAAFTYLAPNLNMGPQAMEGDLKVAAGTLLKAGYDFTMPGAHAAASVAFLGANVLFNATCATGSGGGPITVPMTDGSYADPAGSSAWLPSGTQSSPVVYQGSIAVPDLCHGGLVRLKQGGTFSAVVTSTDNTAKFNVRWHYSANGTPGGWSGTKTVVPY
jgi:hypothetical protein